MLRKVALGAMILASLALGHMTSAHGSGSTVDRKVYLAKDRNEELLPWKLILKGCGPTEDSLAHLRMIAYEPGSRVVYRCSTNF